MKGYGLGSNNIWILLWITFWINLVFYATYSEFQNNKYIKFTKQRADRITFMQLCIKVDHPDRAIVKNRLLQ